MRAVLIASLLALSFTTGFTCSKHSPDAPQAAPAAPPAQEQMAAPAPGTEAAPPAAAPAPGAPAEAPPAH